MKSLKAILARHGLSQRALARHLDISPAALSRIINQGVWPKHRVKAELRDGIHDFLAAHGVTLKPRAKKTGAPRIATARPVPPSKTNQTTEGEDPMLLRKQNLTPAAKKHFGIFRDPFGDEQVQSHEDIFLSSDIRYVREAMYQTARNGGMLAVIAESGAGKTTLLRDLDDRIARESQPIVLVRPYVLAMEDSDARGKTLKSSHIAEAIMAAVAPLERLKSSPEARFAQLHKALKESHAAGYRHCLVIDEAHSLPIATIKHLKRFFELELGFKKLLAIVLVGQPELSTKLSERNPEVREVVQRCEVVGMAPLDGARLADFLKFKFDRAGKPMAEVVNDDAIEALRGRLTIATTRRDRKETVSLLYPLAIGNLLTAAMNLAAEIGSPAVTADVVKGV